jgi:hypothetical protein
MQIDKVLQYLMQIDKVLQYLMQIDKGFTIINEN